MTVQHDPNNHKVGRAENSYTVKASFPPVQTPAEHHMTNHRLFLSRYSQPIRLFVCFWSKRLQHVGQTRFT